MPKVTVYIRNEDYEAWKNVVEKTKFMHDALTSGLTTIPPRSMTIASSAVPMTVDNPSQLKQVLVRDVLRGAPSCKHGAAPAFCKFSRPGKPCK